MSAATEQLSKMAQELQRLMAQFKIKNGDGAESDRPLLGATGEASGTIGKKAAGDSDLQLVS
jgi:hypothetical protein